MNTHIDLHMEGTENDTQPVEVESIATDVYRILYSPGFVEDIAAGDVIRVTDKKKGTFEVVEYGGNVSVKISDVEIIIEKLQILDEILSHVGARRDGNLKHVAVWTIPVKSGFQNIEAAIAKACELLKEPTWWYGNVYDSQGSPLNWW
ncbi:MAG: DUF4265 domain-containing protein [Aestuariibacter sp.]